MVVKITIKGKVHNVGYRLFLLNEADRLLIPKFDARNVMIGDKEALIVFVDGEGDQIKEFVEFVKTNKPPNAIVEGVEVEEFDGKVMDIDRFRSALNTEQLSKIVQVGLTIVNGINNLNSKIDGLNSKMDNLNLKMDRMLQKQDETVKEIRDVKNVIREESEKTRVEIKSLRSDLREYMDYNLEMVREEITEIKEALRRAGIM